MGKFFADRRGNVALIFALSLLPIAILVGGSIDLSRMRVERTKLQSAADAAVLAAAQLPSSATQGQLDTLVDDYLAGNFEGESTLLPAASTVVRNGTEINVQVYADVPMTFAALLGANTRRVTAEASAARSGGSNIEMALVLDVTGSMQGDRIEALQAAADDLIDAVVLDEQPPTAEVYTRMAIVPYSTAVNVGSRADTLRGAPTATKAVSNVTWHTGSTRTISAISKASQMEITTTANHGFSNGNTVWIVGVHGMTQLTDEQLNDGPFTVVSTASKKFKLKDKYGNYVSSSYWSSYTTSGGSAQVAKCASSDCRLTVTTAANHGYSNNDYVALDGFTGALAALNGEVVSIANKTAKTFTPTGLKPVGFYSSSAGEVNCTDEGCRYYRFQAANWWGGAGSYTTYELDDCVTERTTAQRYTDHQPNAGHLLGAHYVPDADSTDCPSQEIMTLTSNKTNLHAAIENLTTGGGTAGQIGVAWGWYMLAPNFNSALSNNASAYGAEHTIKAAVIMTDGEFNRAYCNGVSAIGYGNEIYCNPDNDDPFDQAEELCDAMHDEGIIVYTVGFQITAGSDAADFMEYCASDDGESYLAADSSALASAFQAIGDSISELRLTL